jgi:hypothetical protein
MLNKLILRALLSITLALSLSGAANAILIKQDILFDTMFDLVDEYEVIGNVTIDTDTADGYGYIDNTWKSFTFYGFDVDVFDPVYNLFVGIVDLSDLTAGLNYLFFDVTLFDDLSFSGVIDDYAADNSFTYSVFNNADASLFDAGNLAFGEASVVPAPETLVLLLIGITGLVSRRKNN